MEEKTADEISTIYLIAGDSVTLINKDKNYAAYKTANGDDTTLTETEWKDLIKRNVDHLEIIKAYKKLDGTTSIWTSESFTDIDAAITKGKTLYAQFMDLQKLQETKQQLLFEKEKQFANLYEITGAIKLLDQQILEMSKSEDNQPTETQASTPQEKTASSK